MQQTATKIQHGGKSVLLAAVPAKRVDASNPRDIKELELARQCSIGSISTIAINHYL